MHDDTAIVLGRLDRVLRERISPTQSLARVPLTVRAWHAPGEPVPYAVAAAADYQPFAVGDPWGPSWRTTWFEVTGSVPQDWAGRHVEASLDLGFHGEGPGFEAEALVYAVGSTAGGRPVKGLHPLNHWIPVAPEARGGEPVHWLIEATSNPDIQQLGRGTAEGDRLTSSPVPAYRLRHADLVLVDDETRALATDLTVLSGVVAELDAGDPRRHELIRAAERALDVLDLRDLVASSSAARAELVEALGRAATASAHVVAAVANAHIDTAWLWPLRETRRKIGRTLANVVQLAQSYPELVFAMPQAVQLAWAKEDHPITYAAVRELVEAGQLVPVGGMWVEADGNLPGGESLVRQLAYGKRFFLDEFGVETTGVWLPDSFGYTAAYPQLARLAGNDWFLTQKISWNQTNTFPHHTFWWEGIDGTRVFTHFPPSDTYTGDMTSREIAHGMRRFADKGRATTSLYPFGHGDGGGGPTREMMERARRLADLEGSPRVRIESPDSFFARARAEYPDAPVWSGELYLELHRGTYTSQHRGKQGNRECERLLHDAELWSSTAALADPAYEYPDEELDRIWREVLVLQFHDILPGSSIRWVHREAEEQYAVLVAELEAVIARAVATLPGRALNSSPFARREVAAFGGRDVVVAAEPFALGAVVDSGDPGYPAPVVVEADATGWRMDNGLVAARFDDHGNLVALIDRSRERNLLAHGKIGGLLQLHDDLPNLWDAWDVDPHYRHRVVDLVSADDVELIHSGPLRATLRVTRSIRATQIVQDIQLRAGATRLEFDTTIDWQEDEAFLKVGFPLDVHAARTAAEIQFGHVERPTHTNTTWDTARFELAAHRWVHVGEPGFGVALLTDSTYGYDAVRTTEADDSTTTTVRLSLLRAPRYPDPDADRGRHTLRYAIGVAPEVGAAIRHGYEFTRPLRPGAAGGDAAVGDAKVPPPVVVVVAQDVGGVGGVGTSAVLETVKLADDRSGDVIVRLYESHGRRTSLSLRTAFEWTTLTLADLLERPTPDEPLGRRATLALDDGTPVLTLRPFQVATLRFAGVARGRAG